LGDQLTRARITYVSKDDLRVQDFEVELTPEWEAKFEHKIARLELYRADSTALPLRLPLDGKGERSWLCNYCSFAKKCWNEDQEGVEF